MNAVAYLCLGMITGSAMITTGYVVRIYVILDSRMKRNA